MPINVPFYQPRLPMSSGRGYIGSIGQGLPYKPSGMAQGIGGLAAIAQAIDQAKQVKRQRDLQKASELLNLAGTTGDYSVLQSPEFQQASRTAGWPEISHKTVDWQKLLQGGGYEQPTLNIGPGGEMKGMSLRAKRELPEQLQKDLAEGVAAIQSGQADPDSVYWGLVPEWQDYAQDIKRILYPGQQQDIISQILMASMASTPEGQKAMETMQGQRQGWRPKRLQPATEPKPQEIPPEGLAKVAGVVGGTEESIPGKSKWNQQLWSWLQGAFQPSPTFPGLAAIGNFPATVPQTNVPTPAAQPPPAAPLRMPKAPRPELEPYWPQIPDDIKPLVTRALFAGQSVQEIVQDLKSRGIVK